MLQTAGFACLRPAEAITTARKPSDRFCVTLAEERERELRVMVLSHLSPTMLESTLSLLKTSPSPRSTNSTSCPSAAA